MPLSFWPLSNLFKSISYCPPCSLYCRILVNKGKFSRTTARAVCLDHHCPPHLTLILPLDVSFSSFKAQTGSRETSLQFHCALLFPPLGYMLFLCAVRLSFISDFFCKRPQGNYFRLCGAITVSVASTQL